MIIKKWKQIINKWGIWVLLLICVICGMISFFRNQKNDNSDVPYWKQAVSSFFCHQMEKEYFQIPRYLDEGEEISKSKTERLIREQFLLFNYLYIQEEPKENEDTLMAELIRQHEGTDEDIKNIDEESLDYNEDALHIENSVLQEMERENSLHNADENDDMEADSAGENEESAESIVEFQIAEYPAYSYDWSENWDYEALVSNFYAVDASTYLKEEYVGLKQLLEPDLSVDKNADGPQILIYHTHAHEGFVDSVPGDSSTTIVGAGEKLATLLEEE